MAWSTALADLAPTGKLRVGIMYTNPVVAARNPETGHLGGISVALARELGRRMNVPVELVGYENTAQMLGDLQRGAWDIAFTAIAPEHVKVLAYTAPYRLFIEDAKASGLVLQLIEQHGIRGAVVAPGAAVQ